MRNEPDRACVIGEKPEKGGTDGMISAIATAAWHHRWQLHQRLEMSGMASPRSVPLGATGLRERLSGWRLVRQRRWKCPIGEQVRNLSGHDLQPVDGCAKVADEDTVGGKELVTFLVVVGVY